MHPATRYPSRVDRDEIIRVLRAFDAAELEYVLIGATAMGFRLKKGTVRVQDRLDAVALRERFNLKDEN